MPDEPPPKTIAAEPLIEVRDLSFGYDKHNLVLDRISGTIHAGRICAIIGPNAAGKSTLLKLLLGQVEPQRGSVTIGGRAVGALKPDERAVVISYVPQRPAAHLSFRVSDVVEMGRFARPHHEQAVNDAIDQFELNDLRDRIYGELSVGQQQRVALARATAQAADSTPHEHAMLLDEPISAMDLKHIHATMQQLRAAARRGYAIVMVLHDLNLTATYADDVWLLDQGRLIHAGPWQDVLQPDVLQPVYQVDIRDQSAEGDARPLFHVPEPATM